MKIAVISDIHSNSFYLKEVLSAIKKQDVDEIYCLGDIIGCYDNPNEVIEIVRENNIKAVQGNHEEFLLKTLEYDKEKEHIYNIETQNQAITEENKLFLKSLPEFIELELENKKLFFSHNLNKDYSRYIYNTADIDKDFTKNYDYCFFGHTHIPLITSYYGTMLINPGSVGQPRDYSKQPSFVVLDLKTNQTSLCKMDINVKYYIESLENLDMDSSLINILKRS